MALTTTVRKWWSDRRCKTTGLSSISFLGRGEPFTIAKVLVQPECVEIWKAMEAALYATGYGDATNVGSLRHCPAGIGGKTCQPSGKDCSLHNYCLAIDVDPFGHGNPYFRKKWPLWSFKDVKFTRVQVEAVEAIRMNNGSTPLKWLGWAIGDTMHWQINISPASAVSGVNWSTVQGGVPPPPPPPGESEGVFMAYGRVGDVGDNVVEIQKYLITQGYDLGPWGPDGDGSDGDWGSLTIAAVKAWQTDRDVTEYNENDIAISRGSYWGARSVGVAVGESSKGEQGEQGVKGDRGAVGATGVTGKAGIDGAKGPQGEDGVAGASGVQGEQGASGTDGAKGAQGDPGVQGEQGAGLEVGTGLELSGPYVVTKVV